MSESSPPSLPPGAGAGRLTVGAAPASWAGRFAGVETDGSGSGTVAFEGNVS